MTANGQASRLMKAPKRYEITKRAIDVGLAGLGLIITAPIQLGLMAVILKKLGKPVIFTQERPGRDGQIFLLRKFRTMRSVDEAKGLVTDAERITPFGQFLRSTSLDELPTLVNVLRGEMSLVGPRPLLVDYLPLYSPEQSQRHFVRPGITGLAQVRGRNSLTWEEKFALDVEYVHSRSLSMDAQILGETVVSVVKRKNISADNSVTMPKFTGTNSAREDTR